MKISIEETGEVARDINILIPRDTFDVRFGAQLTKAAQMANIKGFRPGKAPKNVIKKMYGEKIQNDVLEELIGEAYKNAIQDNNLNVIGYPKIDIKPIEDKKDLEVKASVSLYPEPEIKDWQNVEFEYETQEYSEDLLEAELTRARESFTQISKIEERTTAEDGDMVVLNFDATIDGEPFDNSSGENARVVIGGGSYPESFEKGLIGLEISEEKELTVQMPEDIANPAIAGKEAIYKVQIQSLHARNVPELTDEFVSEQNLGESVSDFTNKVKENIERDVERQNKQAKETKMFEAIIAKNTFEVPELLVDEEIRQILFEARLLDPRNKESYQISVERFRESLGEGAEFRVRQRVVLERISESLDIEITESDIEAWLKEKEEELGASSEEVKGYYGYPERADQIKQMLRSESAIAKILEGAKFKAVKAKDDKEKPKKKSTSKAKSPKTKKAANK